MTRDELIQRYADGPDEIEDALRGITERELDAIPAPGEWSPRVIVHHTADGEIRAVVRLKQLLAEDDTVIQGYDEAAWASVLPYGGPIEPSLAVIRAVRAP